MRTLSSVMAIILMTSLAAIQVQAKRGAPKDVPPVTHNAVIYSAPHDQMGCVVAKDEKSGNLLWVKQVYVVKFDPNLEKDIQDCFITELRFADGKLIVSNERDSQFELNVETLAVKVLKGSDVVAKAK